MAKLHWPHPRWPEALTPQLPPEPVSVPPFQGKELISFETAKTALSEQFDDVRKLKAYISGVACPLCGNAKLSLVAYEKGFEGWEAAVTCDSCFIKGVFNDGGFRVVKPFNIEVKAR